MSASMNSLQNFSEKWCRPESQPERVDEEELTAIETKFGIRFPSDYREQVLSVGLPNPTLALLSAIDDAEVDLHDLLGLCKPAEIREETLGWREAGLPENLLVIGSDRMGNKFCFDLVDLKKSTGSRTPVYF
jgi:hypothetical protein